MDAFVRIQEAERAAYISAASHGPLLRDLIDTIEKEVGVDQFRRREAELLETIRQLHQRLQAKEEIIRAEVSARERLRQRCKALEEELQELEARRHGRL